jgi:hypothetical protein
LLDANVLIALFDPDHSHSKQAHAWFSDVGHLAWATCPVTQNAMVRIMSHPRYGNGPLPADALIRQLDQAISQAGHHFWPDAISLTDQTVFNPARALISGALTDVYLLGLAVANRGRLVTFDQKIDPMAVHGGKDALLVLPGA